MNFIRNTTVNNQPNYLETMERRRLMSSTLAGDGTLTITGTAGNDDIELSRANTTITLVDNGQRRTFDSTRVQRIVAMLGDGNDSFYAANTITQPESVFGGNGNDIIWCGSGNDQVQGQDGNDTLAGGSGADLISGGGGIDEVTYAQSVGNGVAVTLDNVANDGRRTAYSTSDERDNVLSDIENIYGSAGDDYFSALGTTVGHQIKGMAGNDEIYGGSGNDALYGYYGNDTIFGSFGNDSIWGEAGSDLMSGNKGIDDLRYDDTMGQRTRGVTVNLTEPLAQGYEGGNGSAGENDRIRDFENVWGTKYNDLISGNSLDNNLFGLEGDDWLGGYSGNDRLFGYLGNDVLKGMRGNDSLWGEAGSDSLSGGEDWDNVRYDETVNARTVGVVVQLPLSYQTQTTGNGAAGENDTIFNDFEAVFGTNVADQITGDDKANYIEGLDGNDIIRGLAGNDTLVGGRGNDWLWGGVGDDTLLARDGSFGDHLFGEMGTDTVEYDRSFNARFGWFKSDEVVSSEMFR
jgi:Ca2+-binding RTX toxin-like protein